MFWRFYNDSTCSLKKILFQNRGLASYYTPRPERVFFWRKKLLAWYIDTTPLRTYLHQLSRPNTSSTLLATNHFFVKNKTHSNSMQFPRCTELTTSRLHFPGTFSLRLLCQSFASYFHILFLPRCVWSRPSIPVMRRLMPIINLFILSQFSEQQPSNNSTACSRL